MQCRTITNPIIDRLHIPIKRICPGRPTMPMFKHYATLKYGSVVNPTFGCRFVAFAFAIGEIGSENGANSRLIFGAPVVFSLGADKRFTTLVWYWLVIVHWQPLQNTSSRLTVPPQPPAH
jgi:hypothetical protein